VRLNAAFPRSTLQVCSTLSGGMSLEENHGSDFQQWKSLFDSGIFFSRCTILAEAILGGNYPFPILSVEEVKMKTLHFSIDIQAPKKSLGHDAE
jgi:hypothetical protein